MTALLSLRLRLLLRVNMTGFTRQAARAAPKRLALIVVIGGGLLLLISSTLGNLLEYGLRGSNGHELLTPALAWGLSAAMVGIFFYALLTLVGTFTYRSDLGLLLLSPLPPRLILGEKLLAVSGGFSLLLVVVGLPSMLGIGHALHAGIAFTLMSALVVLLLPIPPVSLAMLLIFASMRWIPPNRVRGFTSLLGFGVSALFYVGIQSIGDQSMPLPVVGSGKWDVLPTTWPGHALASISLHQSGTALLYLGATLLFALLCAGIAVDRSAHLLTTGWTTYQEIGRRRAYTRARTDGRVHFLTDPAHPMIPSWRPLGSVMRKEWRTVRRDPKLLGQLAYPLFIEGYTFYEAFGFPWATTTRLQGHVGFIFAASMYGVTTLTAVFLLSILTLPIVNREGSSLYLLALAPVSARGLVIAKWAFCVTPMVLMVEGFLAAGVPILRLSPGQVILDASVLAALILALGGLLLCVGLFWPRLVSEGSKRQVHLTALMVGPPAGVILATAVGMLLAAAYSHHSSNPLIPILAPIAIFALTGTIVAGTLVIAPLLLQRLLTSERRPI